MPRYQYTCKHGHVTERIVPVAKYKEFIKCKANVGSQYLAIPCGLRAGITIGKELHVNTFKPYVEPNFGPEPILVESKQQREMLCEKHNVTYDSVRYTCKKSVAAAVDSVNLGDVKEAIQTGRTPDGEKIQPPVKLSKKEQQRCAQVTLGMSQDQ